MAQHNFEDQAKKQLGEREINPSADAWKRLNEQLDKEIERGRIPFWKYAVAACIIALLGSFLWYQLNQNDFELQQEQIVEEQVNIHKKEPIKFIKNQDVIELIKIPDTEVAVIPKESKKGPPVLASEETKNMIAIEHQDIEAMSYFDTKVAEVVAEVQRLKNEKDAITDAEVEALLASAERAISLQSIINKETKKVDASALLSDVESELERTFRDRVFEVLKNGFNKTRTAVANRNN